MSLFVSFCVIFEIHLYQLASPSRMAFIVVGGWYEVAWMYNCLFVGLMWVHTSRIWSLLYRIMSRKVSSVSLGSYM